MAPPLVACIVAGGNSVRRTEGTIDLMEGNNPPCIPADTTPEVWRLQMQAIGRRSVADRLAEWEALNVEMARLEAVSVRRRHPDYDDTEVARALVRLRHGDDLALSAWPGLPLIDV
jgi:hypothetical protein